VRDYEHLPASHEAMILWAMIALMTRRLAQLVFLLTGRASCHDASSRWATVAAGFAPHKKWLPRTQLITLS
jgi:hypothetical protein